MSRSFNGISDRGTALSVPVAAYPLTIAGWAIVSSTSGIQVLADLANFGADSIYARIAANFPGGGNIYAQSYVPGQQGIVGSSTTFTAGSWFHFTGVFSTTASRTIYLDGGGAASDTSTVNATFDNLTVGAGRYNGSNANWLGGRLSGVAVWNAALTSDEVALLARGADPRTIRPESLVWMMDDEGTDLIGGRDLIWTGSAASGSEPARQMRGPTPPPLWATASSSAFTQALSEVLALADARSGNAGKGLPDTFALTDTRTLGASSSRQEALSLADTRTLGAGASRSESLSLTDTRTLDALKAFAETLSISDARALDVARSLTESLGLTDSRAAGLAKALAELLSLTDAVTASLSSLLLLSLAETLSLGDTAANAPGKGLTEGLSLSDARSFAIASARSETLTLTDTRAMAMARTLAELLGLTDLTDAQIVVLVEITRTYLRMLSGPHALTVTSGSHVLDVTSGPHALELTDV